MEILQKIRKYALLSVNLLASAAGPLVVVLHQNPGLAMGKEGGGMTRDIAKDDPTIRIRQRLINLKRQVELKSVHRTLQECLQIGIQQNMQLSGAYATIQQQEYTLIGVKRQYLPTLSLSSLPPFLGTVTTQSSNTQFQQVIFNPNGTTQVINNTLSNSSSQSYNQFAPYLSLTWSFFQPSLLASINAQNAQVQRQRMIFDVTARSVVLSIQQAYFKLQANESLINSFETIYRINLEQLDYVQQRQQAGLIDIGAVEQAKTQLYSQMNQLINFYESYLQSAASLALAMNEPSDRIIIPADHLQINGNWSDSLDDTIVQALSLREEIQIYLQNEVSLNWNARASILQYLPTLMVQGIYYDLYNKGKTDALVNYQTNSSYGAIGLGVTWNIFDGGIAAARSQALKAESRNARYKAEYERYQVREQIKTTYAAYQAAILSLQNAKANLDAANKTIQVNQARFSVGLSEMTAIVQSMQLLGQASETYSNSLLQYNNAVAELYRYSAKWPNNVTPALQQKVSKLKFEK